MLPRRPVGEGLAQTIQRDGQKRDRHTGFQPLADRQATQRGQNVEPQATGADHGGDNHHVERQHDDLVDADHQAGPGRGNLHPPQQLPGRAAGHPAELHHLGRHLFQGEHGHPDHGRRGVDDGRDHRRHRTEAEEEQHRHQIGEDRNRLHEVEHWRDGLLEPWPAKAGNAQEEAQGDTERHGNGDRAQGDHGAVPAAEDRQVTEAGANQQGQDPVPRQPSHERHQGGQPDPGDRRDNHVRAWVGREGEAR